MRAKDINRKFEVERRGDSGDLFASLWYDLLIVYQYDACCLNVYFEELNSAFENIGN